MTGAQHVTLTYTQLPITKRLTADETREFIKDHSGHFTYGPAGRIMGEHYDNPSLVTYCYKHGDSCSIRYDAGEHFFYITTPLCVRTLCPLTPLSPHWA